MARIYGYCRISNKKQNIERQIRNILAVYPTAIIIREIFTRTSFYGRKEWDKLMKIIKPGDTIIFDSVSRMSGSKDEGWEIYKRLYDAGVSLIFLKEPQINTATYKMALEKAVPLTGTAVDLILEGVNKYLMQLAQEQVKMAFKQSEKEVQDLHQRTKEGIETARLNGKQIGQKPGAKLNVKKAAIAKEVIKKHSNMLDGNLNDEECMKLAEVSRNTYYKYKKELLEAEIEK